MKVSTQRDILLVINFILTLLLVIVTIKMLTLMD